MSVDRIFTKYLRCCNTNEVITYTKYHYTSDHKGRQT
jgi:hypothetical protein